MEQKDNSGCFWVNETKTGNRPDFTGMCKVNGKEMRMAGWKKTSQNGKKYISMVFDNPLPAQSQPQQAESRADDEIPFD